MQMMPRVHMLLNIWRLDICKDLHKLAGNSMCARVVFAVLLILLKATNPVKLRDYLE